VIVDGVLKVRPGSEVRVAGAADDGQAGADAGNPGGAR
jgi:hypothetical protein